MPYNLARATHSGLSSSPLNPFVIDWSMRGKWTHPSRTIICTFGMFPCFEQKFVCLQRVCGEFSGVAGLRPDKSGKHHSLKESIYIHIHLLLSVPYTRACMWPPAGCLRRALRLFDGIHWQNAEQKIQKAQYTQDLMLHISVRVSHFRLILTGLIMNSFPFPNEFFPSASIELR